VMPDWQVCDGLGTLAGAGSDHCCYVNGQTCPFLQVDGPSGRRFACGLYVELGDWDAVHADPRYVASVKPHWDAAGVVGCGPWFGCNRAQWVALVAKGSITNTDVAQNSNCCYLRRYTAANTGQRNAIRNVVSNQLAKWPDPAV